jgi:RNA polymerase sigma factor (sigma-70 family)
VIFSVNNALTYKSECMETMVQTLLKTPSARKELFEDLYKQVFPLVARFVSNAGGTFQDARDIFQDALVIFMERCNDRNDIEFPERYITGIAKHLWLRKYSDNKKLVSMDSFERSLSIPADFYPTVVSNRLASFLEKAGSRCIELLRAYYFDKMSMKELAASFGYGSERSATVQKFKCIEKLREVIKQKSQAYEDFFE